jgi:hypothetical protein
MASSRTHQRWADILMKANVIDELQLRVANAKVGKWGGRLPRVLAELGFADEDAVTELLAKAQGLQVMHLGNIVKDPTAMRALGVNFCEEHAVFPVSLKDRVLTLAMADPNELQITDEAASRARARVFVVMASESQIRTAIARHFHGQALAPPPKARQSMPELPEAEAAAALAPAGSAAAKPERVLNFTAEELQRLKAARDNQEKVASILRALQELLAEKGYVK